MPGDVPVNEEVLKLRKGVTDVVLENKNNVAIRLGVDRPTETYTEDAPLNDGEPGRGTIDAVTGRESRDPNYDTDKARIYISSQTNGDTNFGLTPEGFLISGDTEQISDGNAYIVSKSDSIRIIGREDIRIQNQNNNSSITMKSNGDIVIHTPEKIKIGSDESNQPLVLGSVFLNFAEKILNELSSLQDSINKHKHPTSHGPSGVPFNVSDFANHKENFDDLNSSPIGDEEIVSDFTFTQKSQGA